MIWARARVGVRTEVGTGLVIFDCDGVLVDSEPIASRVLADLLTEIGFPMSAEGALDRYTGITLPAVLAKVEEEWGRPLPRDFLDRLRARDQAAFRAELQPVPGVTAVLDALDAAGMRKCVASSGAPEKLRLTLTVTGLWDRFAPHIYSAAQVPRGKPWPDLFLHAAAAMAVPAQACLVVEDSSAGIKAARAAGMRVIGFAGGGHAGPGYAGMLAEAGAETVVPDMPALGRLLAAAAPA
ncbi:MAG: HAD family hydrolase [Rhodospirillales bacterium]|nr:MAG: HAD family hydrolase [Rhodospirillales bacterium]